MPVRFPAISLGSLFLTGAILPLDMRHRRPAAALLFAVAAGVSFLVEGQMAWLSIVKDTCTSEGSLSSGPCALSAAAASWVSWVGIAILLLGYLGFLAPRIERIHVVWGARIMLASLGGYTLLLLVIGSSSFVPASAAQIVMAVLFLPALLLGLVGGAVGLDGESTRPSLPRGSSRTGLG